VRLRAGAIACVRGLSALAVVLFLLTAAASPAQTDLRAVLRQGNTLLQEGQYEEARREFLRATHEYPRSAEAFALLGIAEIQLHDYGRAEATFQHALELDPNSVEALYNFGVMLLDRGHPRQAMAYLDKAGRLSSPSPELAVNMVRVHLESGDKQASLKIAEASSKSFKDLPAFHLALGKVFLTHNVPAEAVAHLQQADLLAPSQPGILLPLADACVQLLDLACSKDALAKAGKQSEDSAQFHFLKGKTAFLANQPGGGFREIEAAIRRDPGNATYLITLARYHQKYGQQQSAIDELQRAGRIAPDLADIPYGLAISYFIQDDFNSAIDYSTKALKLDPTFDRALFLLAISRFAKSQLTDAEELLGKALRLKPQNAFYHCFQGMVRLSMDRFPERASVRRYACSRHTPLPATSWDARWCA
jgi:tetratricopeptide (TPR) repeat protein